MTDKIEIGEEFTVSKTDNKFVEVKFTYSDGTFWDGCFPLHYPPMSIEYNPNEVNQKLLNKAYSQIEPSSIDDSVDRVKKKWSGSTSSETYGVFKSFLSGNWECRSCGAGKINDQPAARIRDIKKNGFVVATRTKFCRTCQKKQYHDILLMFEIEAKISPEFRKPISNSVKERIMAVLEKKDVFFDVCRPAKDFVIDHKFPSQRWKEPESDNTQLTNEEIKEKFQLLTNQSNMLKSRLCDKCCKTGKRPDFLGIKWFYSGDEEWKEDSQTECGCTGCPWFDLEEWKKGLQDSLKTKIAR
ncbi:hypothetical protein HOH45_08615 [bacterium]|jgi:hypothetical protein|nr:hypothetical protein [Candidatus Neomarinimicrobiota bacterium]MBT6121508.1 hypothetical protein [bacterium]